jgi:predicted Zn-dependent protease
VKSIFVYFVLVMFPLSMLSQPTHSRAEIVQHWCHAVEVTNGPYVDRIKGIEARLSPIVNRLHGPRIHVAVVDSDVINAWEKDLGPQESLICVPVSMIRFMGDGEGEMAFIFAHETGHALDRTCKSAEGREQITPPSFGSALSNLLGGSGRDLLAEQRTCESRADAIGFAIFTKAGYNPYDAAGAFGRLEMYNGDSGVLSKLMAFANDHPMTPDRIAHMRKLLSSQSLREASRQ